MADQEEVTAAVAKRVKQARVTHPGDTLLTEKEAEYLVQAAAFGTPGGFTDAEGEAFLDWACRIRVKCAILQTILEGAVFPDIKGMTDATSNMMLYTRPMAADRQVAHATSEGQNE